MNETTKPTPPRATVQALPLPAGAVALVGLPRAFNYSGDCFIVQCYLAPLGSICYGLWAVDDDGARIAQGRDFACLPPDGLQHMNEAGAVMAERLTAGRAEADRVRPAIDFINGFGRGERVGA